jgi:cell division protein FtsB
LDIKANWPGFAVGAAIIYFAANAVSGDQGLARWAELQRLEQRLEVELELAIQEKAGLDERAAKLKSNDLDLDLVDERARELLGYARADEVVLLPAKANAPNFSAQ